MATFTNQASNLSALGSRFSRLLTVSDDTIIDVDDELTQKRARSFLAAQINRVNKIEDELLLATHDILPATATDDSSTIAELAELCRLTQDATRQKLDLLKSRLEEAGYIVRAPPQPSNVPSTNNKTTTTNSNRRHLRGQTANSSTTDLRRSTTANQTSNVSPSFSSSWPVLMSSASSFGGPLECVLEADVETDLATTPGSQMLSPPSASRTFGSIRDSGGSGDTSGKRFDNKYGRRSSTRKVLTPATPPGMESLSFTATTSNFLQTMSSARHGDRLEKGIERQVGIQDSFLRHVSESPEAYGRRGSDRRLHRPLSLEFRDEDDMITLDTQSTMTKNTRSPAAPRNATGTTSVEERSQFLARMEGMLERVEETILEETSPSALRITPDQPSRPSDELQGFLRPVYSPAAVSVRSSRSHQTEKSTHSVDSRRSQLSAGVKSVQSGMLRPSMTFYEEGSNDDSTGNDSNEDYVDDYDDDSTNVVATLVREAPSPQHREEQNHRDKQGRVPPGEARKTHPLNVFQRPMDILVDNAVGSPAHTNITMDATMMMNDTYNTSLLVAEENYHNHHDANVEMILERADGSDDDNDNVSIMTPILDRYRLDPDDNSIGVKVVPNKRGAGHSSGRHRITTPRHDATLQQRREYQQQRQGTTLSLSRAKTLTQDSSTWVTSPPVVVSSLRSPYPHESVNNSAHKYKVYRKTPHPKRKPTNEDDERSLHSLDENDHPNISNGSYVTSSPDRTNPADLPMPISVPPLRPRSLEPKTRKETPSVTSLRVSVLVCDETKPMNGLLQQSKSESRNRMLLDESDTIDHIDRTIERIDQELAAGSNHLKPPACSNCNVTAVSLPSGRVDPVGKSLIENSLSREKLRYKYSWIKRITLTEFETAPRIVRTQVTIDEANGALDAIGEHFYESMTQNKLIEFLDKDGHDILKPLVGSSVQKSKSLLISLCHWRRLVMRRDATRGMVFAVNLEKESRTFTC